MRWSMCWEVRSMVLSEYLDTLTGQIRCRKARDMVAEEIAAHVEDQAAAYEEEGMGREEAVSCAVKEMGDPVEVGIEMDRIHRPRMEWRLLWLAVLLSLIGLAVQYAMCRSWVERSMLEDNWGMVQYFFRRQCLYTAVGFAVMVVFYRLDYSLIGRWPLVSWCGFVLLCVALLFLMQNQNGQVRIYSLLTLFAPLYAGVLYYFRGKGTRGLILSILMGIPAVFLSLVAVQATAAMELSLVFFFMLLFAVMRGWFGGQRRRTALLLAAAAVVAPAGFLGVGRQFGLIRDYQWDRIVYFLNPYEFWSEGNYQRSRVILALRESRAWGNGMTERLGEIPNMNTDYLVTFLFSYFGILAGCLVVCLLLFLIGRALHVTVKQKNQLGAMVGFGCGLMLLAQTMTYVLANLGVGFLTQKTIPFLSFGLQGAVANGVLLGLILSIYRYKDILQEKKAAGPKHMQAPSA